MPARGGAGREGGGGKGVGREGSASGRRGGAGTRGRASDARSGGGACIAFRRRPARNHARGPFAASGCGRGRQIMAMHDPCLRPPCPNAAGACRGFSMRKTACVDPAKHGTANGGTAVGTPGNEGCGTGTGTGGAAAARKGIFRPAASSRGPSLRLWRRAAAGRPRSRGARRLEWMHPAQGPRADPPHCEKCRHVVLGNAHAALGHA